MNGEALVEERLRLGLGPALVPGRGHIRGGLRVDVVLREVPSVTVRP